MDVNEDVLFLHITTHGSSDHVLSFQQPGYKLYGLNAQYLGKALAATRIRYRVLVVSACYAGGFVAPFAGGNTLTVAAASPVRMSYGCGNDSEITDFSRAFYSQALRQESSVVRAARKAVQIIHESELASKRVHSYPQVQAGLGIDERLRLLEEQIKVSRQPRLRKAPGLPAN